MVQKPNESSEVVLELEGGNPSLEILGEVVEGGLKLFLSCKRLDEAHTPITSPAELRRLLAEHVYESFLHDEIIEDIAERLNKREDTPRRRVAQGKAPIPGRDGKLLLLVKPYKKNKSDGEFVSSRFIKYFDNIEPGTVVGRIYKPSTGTDGMDVFGKNIVAATGQETSVELGHGLRLEEDPRGLYSTIVADCFGYLEVEGSTLNMREVLQLRSDIDFHTGDVDFLGSVDIRGNIAKGFMVRARGDITIQGSVHCSRLISSQGSIVVKGTVTGELSSARSIAASGTSVKLLQLAQKELLRDQLTAEKSITIDVIESASVSAKGTIEITKEAHNSRLRTRASLLMPRGRLLSGSAYAVCGFEAKSYGTKADTDGLALYLCSDVESSAEYIELLDKSEVQRKALEMVVLLLGPFADDSAAIQRLQAQHRARLLDLQEKRRIISESLAQIEVLKKELLETAHYNSVLRVNFLEQLYAGVKVHAGDTHFLSEERVTGPRTLEYFPETQQFEIRDLQPLQCEFDEADKEKDNE